jgi:hypothetical protein
MRELAWIALQGHEAYLNNGSEPVARQVGGLADKQLEGVYLPPVHAVRSFRTALVLSSYRPHNWKANIVKAVEESLNGQLRDQVAPAICIRFNNLSDQECENLFWGKSSYHEDSGTALMSPSDAICWEIARSSRSHRDRLCALMIVNRPAWSPSGILDQNASAGSILEEYLFAIQPVGSQLRKVIDHWA